MKKLLEKIKFGLLCVIGTHLGRLVLLFALTFGFNALANNATSVIAYTLGHYGFLVASGALLLYVLVFIMFAWVINPLREYKAYAKSKKEMRNK